MTFEVDQVSTFSLYRNPNFVSNFLAMNKAQGLVGVEAAPRVSALVGSSGLSNRYRSKELAECVPQELRQ